jgi:acyl carrier protein
MSDQLTMKEIEGRICDAIATFGPERSEVTREATLESLDVDSLDLVELAQIVEEDFGVRLEPSDLEHVATVGDAIDVIAAKVT